MSSNFICYKLDTYLCAVENILNASFAFGCNSLTPIELKISPSSRKNHNGISQKHI